MNGGARHPHVKASVTLMSDQSSELQVVTGRSAVVAGMERRYTVALRHPSRARAASGVVLRLAAKASVSPVSVKQAVTLKVTSRSAICAGRVTRSTVAPSRTVADFVLVSSSDGLVITSRYHYYATQ